MQLSVVVLNYNVSDFLYLCLKSVQDSIVGLDAEIIVVDNASSDDSCHMVKTSFPEVTLIENKENVGFSRANNQAVAIAKGEYICILNPDTVVSETTFVNAIQKAQVLPNLGVLGIQLLDGKGTFLPESKRNLPTPLVSICKVLGEKFSKHRPYYASHIDKNKEGTVQVLVGAFMLIKKAIYTEAKGFDEDYFMYGEDIDLSYKIEKLGYENYYYGSEKIIHFKGESTLKDAIYRKRFFGAMKLFYKKHFNSFFLVNSFFYLGIKLSSLISKKSSKALPVAFSKAIVLSDKHELAERIEQKTGIKTSLSTVNEVYGNSDFKESVICFLDMDKMSYSQAILLIESSVNSKIHFRFVSKGINKAIGSDTSYGRGQVISL